MLIINSPYCLSSKITMCILHRIIAFIYLHTVNEIKILLDFETTKVALTLRKCDRNEIVHTVCDNEYEPISR